MSSACPQRGNLAISGSLRATKKNNDTVMHAYLPERVYSSTLRLAGPFQVIGFADLRFGSVIAPVSTSDTDRL